MFIYILYKKSSDFCVNFVDCYDTMFLSLIFNFENFIFDWKVC